MRKALSVATGLLLGVATHIGGLALGQSTTVTNNVAWLDDSLPAGAVTGSDGGDAWTWVSSNPAPYFGTSCNLSSIGAGEHQHFFYGATQTLQVNVGDTLIAYVYIDPANVPTELMIQWNDGSSWEHRAYWGAYKINYGANGTVSCRSMGALPATGKWVRLEVPASQVGLEGSKLAGMAFSLYGGRAAWDYAGKATVSVVNSPASNTNSTTSLSNAVAWVDDSVPTGATIGSDGGDSWNWVTSNPTPISGSRAHQSATASGEHQHFFSGATATMSTTASDMLFAYAYIDPANLPSEIMLQWNDGSWEHRAYWGANNINYGVNGTASCRYMGALPTAGQWVRLQVPATNVNLAGSTINGMAFSAYNGRVTWDYAGKASANTSTNIVANTNSASSGSGSGSTSTNTSQTSVVWVEDAIPAGASTGTDGGDTWSWVSGNPAPYAGSSANQSIIAAGLHQHYFYGATATLPVATGESLFAYVFIDPANVPSEIMLQWNDGSWEHRAYWGANNISYGSTGTASRRYIGPVPQAGQWVRLEVPASQVALEGSTLTGMAFSTYDGRATFDHAGKSSTSSTNSSTGDSSSGPTNNVPSTNTVPVVGTNTPASTNPPIVISDPPTNPVVVTTNSTPTNNPATNPPIVISTNGMPGLSIVDYATLALPPTGTNALHVLAPTILDLKLINTKQMDPAAVTQWNLVDANGNFLNPGIGAFVVTVNGQVVPVVGVGFKRRALYAPFEMYDFRIENDIYLQLASPVSDGQTVQVLNPAANLWNASMQFVATVDPLRYSPSIHVNQEGYMPNYVKKAMVGQYLGSLGEMNIAASSGFTLVDANSGQTVYTGTLSVRADQGYTYTPAPYQKVYEADFTSFNTPGEYRLVVPGMGGSLPFLIDPGIAMDFCRAYELGLFHQRCGTNLSMPATRFEHGPCHFAPASVPWPASSYGFTWTTISNYGLIHYSDNPVQTAPNINANTLLFPYVRQGTLDTSGGHHDAGDYSKYTINCASLVAYLMTAVDSLPGVAALDNLGIPESGDGISDILQEAKWEADYISKIQDTDGGFYFLTYPVNREYEAYVTPDHGDPQVVWPKTTSVTAASVAALAQCASSPAFKAAYPAVAAKYLSQAKLGWQFLTNAINKYGLTGAYQKITHYGDNFADQDELAWAACEMFLATGDQSIHQLLRTWFDPSNHATWQYGWHHMIECYGHAIRSYAFAPKNGKMPATSLDATYLQKCQTEIIQAGNDVMNWSQMGAYGSSFPDATKRVLAGGWFFSLDQAFDLAVASQFTNSSGYMTALLANMNYEGGCNPVNVSYITGMGWKRQKDIVSQWHSVTPTMLPPSGIPYGNITASMYYTSTYAGMPEELAFPSDTATTAPYPFYDRWTDGWNVSAEMVVLNQARALGALSFLAAQTAPASQPWKPVAGTISVPSTNVGIATPITLTLSAPGIDLSSARITWEGRDQDPTYGQTFTFIPQNNGTNWVQAEAQLPDGRRVFAKANFNVNSPNVVWVNDSVPAGATLNATGGDSWNWVSSNPAPFLGTSAHQSAIAAGAHQHYFYGASSTLALVTGDTLYCYVYIDPANPPTEIELQWNDGSSWEHRAYWGANSLSFGVDGTNSRRNMGALPAVGQWVQLKVPASQVGLEGATVSGMAFTLYGGRATWDAAGRLSAGN